MERDPALYLPLLVLSPQPCIPQNDCPPPALRPRASPEMTEGHLRLRRAGRQPLASWSGSRRQVLASRLHTAPSSPPLV